MKHYASVFCAIICFFLCGCKTDNRSNLRPDEALLGHWIDEKSNQEYYFAKGKFWNIEDSKKKSAYWYTLRAIRDPDILEIETLPSQYTQMGVSSLIEGERSLERTFTFEKDRMRVQVDLAITLNEGPVGGLRQRRTFPKPTERQFWRYKDDKQEPPPAAVNGSEPNAPPQLVTDTNTYDGTWIGASASGFHIREIVITKNDFPCDGTVAIQNDGDQIINMPVVWQEKDGQLVGMFGDGEKKDMIATVKLAPEGLSGQIKPPIILGGPKELVFSGFHKGKSGK